VARAEHDRQPRCRRRRRGRLRMTTPTNRRYWSSRTWPEATRPQERLARRAGRT